jgi:hypothetical protein
MSFLLITSPLWFIIIFFLIRWFYSSGVSHKLRHAFHTQIETWIIRQYWLCDTEEEVEGGPKILLLHCIPSWFLLFPSDDIILGWFCVSLTWDLTTPLFYILFLKRIPKGFEGGILTVKAWIQERMKMKDEDIEERDQEEERDSRCLRNNRCSDVIHFPGFSVSWIEVSEERTMRAWRRKGLGRTRIWFPSERHGSERLYSRFILRGVPGIHYKSFSLPLLVINRRLWLDITTYRVTLHLRHRQKLFLLPSFFHSKCVMYAILVEKEKVRVFVSLDTFLTWHHFKMKRQAEQEGEDKDSQQY